MVRNGENKGIWMLDNLDMTHQALKQTRMLEIVGYDSPTIEQRELNETKQELRIENARKREANFVQVSTGERRPKMGLITLMPRLSQLSHPHFSLIT